MGSFTGAIVATVVGLGVGIASVVGVVQSQVSAGESPNGSVSSQVNNYGTNAKF